MSFFEELKHRNVLRVAIAYLAVSWLIIQIVETIFPVFGLSDALIRLVIILLAIGFPIVLIFSWLYELTPDGLQLEKDADHSGSRVHRTSKKLDRAIIVVLAVSLGYFAVDKFVLDPARDVEMVEEAADQARNEALVGSYGDKSIAVLSFRDMSPDQDQEYFSDGIAEELLNLLATIQELKVISRSSAFSFKGSNATLVEIAEKLDVTYILEGSVRKSGNRIRITAQLIDARIDAHVWSKTYDRVLDDVFAIQDEISAQVVEQLKLTLLGEPVNASRVDPAAYELFLKAHHIVSTEDSSRMLEAQELLNSALAIDPKYVKAFAELGRVDYRLRTMGSTESPGEFEARQRTRIDRIVEIDPDGVTSLFLKGWVALAYDDEIQLAAHYFERALRLDPNDIDVLRVVVLMLLQLGRTDDAIAVSRSVILRDPACSVCVNNLVMAYRQAGRHEEAREALQELRTWIAPGDGYYWSYGVVLLIAGQPDEALAEFEQIGSDGLREMATIMAMYDLGRADEVEVRFREMREQADANPEGVARIYAWMDDADRAFEWIEKMIALQGPEKLREIDTDLYQKIKFDPRWSALREEHGICDPDYSEIEFKIYAEN